MIKDMEYQVEHAMCDLETLGKRPGCPILSIGAVMFNRQGLGATFFAQIKREPWWKRMLGLALKEDPETVKWWANQEPKARRTYDYYMTGQGYTLEKALSLFNDWLQAEGGGSVRVRGNGADFDNPILDVAYAHVGLSRFWGYNMGRCYRTMKNTHGGPSLERIGTHHNALDDAVSQAQHLVGIIQANPSIILA